MTDCLPSGDAVPLQIDGQGGSWRRVMRKRVPPLLWDALVAEGRPLGRDGDRCYPDSSYWRAAEDDLTYPGFDEAMAQACKSVLRPVLVALRNCERVSLTGCDYTDSPAWGIHALQCKDLTVSGIRVFNPPGRRTETGSTSSLASGCWWSARTSVAVTMPSA